MKRWTEKDLYFFRKNYPEKGKMWCANKLGRSEGSIRWQAWNLGLRQNPHSAFAKEWKDRSAKSRVGLKRPGQSLVIKRTIAAGKFKKTDAQRAAMSVARKTWHRNNPHPRGMKGKKHTQKTKDQIGVISRARWHGRTDDENSAITRKGMEKKIANGTLSLPRDKVSWRSGWRTIGGKKKYYRSRWEANYARYLEWLKSLGEIRRWEHEPKTFWFDKIKRGCRTYLPDFLVVENDGSESYHEVKGWMDARSKTKLNRMRIYHPDVRMVLVDGPAYKKIAVQMKRMIDGWEQDSRKGRE